MVYIYGLTDPRTDKIRYIGWCIDIKRRYRNHICQCKGDKSYKSNWIRQLLSLKLKPELIVLDEVLSEDWALCENAWILYGFEQGWPLTNGTLGGEGGVGHTVSKEIRNILSEINIGKKLSEETKNKIKISVTGNKNPFYGRHHTEDMKNKLRRLYVGRTLSKDTKNKISKANTGRICSEETKIKIGNAQRGEKSYMYGKKGGKSKFTDDEELNISLRYLSGETQTKLSKEYNVRQSTIGRIVIRVRRRIEEGYYDNFL